MGFAIGYRTTELISSGLQQEIVDALNDLSTGRTWLSCEPPILVDQSGELVGFSKPNFSPHPDDIAAAEAENLPDGTLNDLLDVLCEISLRFDVDFEISHDHSDGPLGYIRHGVCDEEVRTQCSAISDLASELGSEDFDLDDL